MKQNLYCVRDILSGFMPPMIDVNDSTAIRNFKVGIKANPTISANPQDYELYAIGTFDTETSVIESHVPARLLIRGNKDE